jgi:hypothetical protein
MTNGRFSQTPPDRANELFEKLLATFDQAVKTRERLFADLKRSWNSSPAFRRSTCFPC